MEEDAASFKPTGEMIYSYTRSASKGKGKNVVAPEPLHPEDEDAIVYEVYHVRD